MLPSAEFFNVGILGVGSEDGLNVWKRCETRGTEWFRVGYQSAGVGGESGEDEAHSNVLRDDRISCTEARSPDRVISKRPAIWSSILLSVSFPSLKPASRRKRLKGSISLTLYRWFRRKMHSSKILNIRMESLWRLAKSRFPILDEDQTYRRHSSLGAHPRRSSRGRRVTWV